MMALSSLWRGREGAINQLQIIITSAARVRGDKFKFKGNIRETIKCLAPGYTITQGISTAAVGALYK